MLRVKTAEMRSKVQTTWLNIVCPQYCPRPQSVKLKSLVKMKIATKALEAHPVLYFIRQERGIYIFVSHQSEFL